MADAARAPGMGGVSTTRFATMDDLAVRMSGISKSFSGVSVLEGVDLELRRGEVHALAGGNGAGKSTLMKILRGVHQPDDGTIEIDGQAVHLASVHDAMSRGIAMIFQEFSVVPTLTVAQNVFLGRERRGAFGLLDDRASVERTRELFGEMGVTVDPNRRLEDLSTAFWQLTEIAKARSQNARAQSLDGPTASLTEIAAAGPQDARVLIMDEPTASLAKDETDHLFDLIRSLAGQGMAIVYITHRMEEIFRVADRVTVLRDGRLVATTAVGDLSAEDLVEQIVGRRMESALEWTQRNVDRNNVPLLEVQDLHMKPRLRGVSFELHHGEILGLAGLMGSGRTETVRALFGIDRIDSGIVKVRGREISIRNSGDAIGAGISLVPEDRRLQGLVLEHSVRNNLLLPLLGRFSRAGWLDDRKGDRIAAKLVSDLDVKVADVDRPVQILSGGNQQKVVLAKWMGTEPDIILMDEPTAGVDIGTKVEIVGMIRALADAGKGVVFISSEFPELLAVCDRVLVFRDGVIESSLERGQIAGEDELHLAVQGYQRTTTNA
jgi:ribose transport system ATP-binding protein